MKLQDLYEASGESEKIAKRYIGYAKFSSLSGATFDVQDDAIIIRDGQEDDFGDKYSILKKDTSDDVWMKILSIAKKGKQW